MLRTLNSEGRLSLAVQGFQNRRGIEVQGAQSMQRVEQAMDCLELAGCWTPLLSVAMAWLVMAQAPATVDVPGGCRP